MRKALVPALLAAAAAWSYAQVPLRTPVEVPVIGFKAVLGDGRVLTSWHRYRREDFAIYRLVKSRDADPVFPATPALYSADTATTISYEDGLLSTGTWRYRLCIVTRFGDRWLSPVVSVDIAEKDLKHAAPTAADFE